MKRWLDYLANERFYKANRIHALSLGWTRLHMTADGVTRDVTDEELERLRADIAEIDEILRDEGYSLSSALAEEKADLS